jgi:hypothetical protein
MAVRRVASYALRAVLVLIAGFVVFDLLSAYAIARGAPFYLALALGLAACPVAPLIWHLLGERKRRRKRAAMKVPPKASTTGLERLLLRAGAVGVAVIAALVGLTGGSWDAVRQHGLWFVPHSEPKLSTHSPLVALVPARAEAFVWLRPSQAVCDALTALGADAARLETVFAVGAQQGSRTDLDATLITRFPAASCQCQRGSRPWCRRPPRACRWGRSRRRSARRGVPRPVGQVRSPAGRRPRCSRSPRVRRRTRSRCWSRSLPARRMPTA